jgi:hypothetical protein
VRQILKDVASVNCKEVIKMGFLLCIIQYVLEMIVLLAVGIAGACIGIKLRKNKDAKAAANQTAATKE